MRILLLGCFLLGVYTSAKPKRSSVVKEAVKVIRERLSKKSTDVGAKELLSVIIYMDKSSKRVKSIKKEVDSGKVKADEADEEKLEKYLVEYGDYYKEKKYKQRAYLYYYMAMSLGAEDAEGKITDLGFDAGAYPLIEDLITRAKADKGESKKKEEKLSSAEISRRLTKRAELAQKKRADSTKKFEGPRGIREAHNTPGDAEDVDLQDLKKQYKENALKVVKNYKLRYMTLSGIVTGIGNHSARIDGEKHRYVLVNGQNCRVFIPMDQISSELAKEVAEKIKSNKEAVKYFKKNKGNDRNSRNNYNRNTRNTGRNGSYESHTLYRIDITVTALLVECGVGRFRYEKASDTNITFKTVTYEEYKQLTSLSGGK